MNNKLSDFGSQLNSSVIPTTNPIFNKPNTATEQVEQQVQPQGISKEQKSQYTKEITLAAMKYIQDEEKIYIKEKLRVNIETLIGNLNIPSEVMNYLKDHPELSEAIKQTIENMEKEIDQTVKEKANELIESKADEILEDELEQFKDMMASQLKQLSKIKRKQVLTFVDALGNEVTQKGLIYHELYEKVMTLLANKKHVFLVGPSGAGKNVLAEQIAKDLGRTFYFVNAVTDEMKLEGYTDANGNYHTTPLMEAVEKGGVFFFDEVDASVPEALITMNALLANGYLNHPQKGRVYMHEDTLILAAGNTIGEGATSQYNGRNKIDAATLNRFAVLNFDYSPTIENALVAAQGSQEAENLHLLFKYAREYNASVEGDIVWGTRDLKNMLDMLGLFTIEELLDMYVFRGRDHEFKSDYIKQLRNHKPKIIKDVTKNSIAFDEIYNIKLK